jgi:hypothetical protein
VEQLQGRFLQDALTKYANDTINNFSDFLFVQMFWAATPENVRQLISHKDQTRLTILDANKVFNTEARVQANKKLTAITEDTNTSQTDLEVAAFKQQPRPQQQCQGGQQNYHGNRNQAQNSNCRQNFGYCRQSTKLYSQIQQCSQRQILHLMQNDWSNSAPKQIRDNKPCVDTNGRTFWLKFNAALDNTNLMQSASKSNDGDGSVFC